MLDRRGLHQVRGRPLERTRDAVVERQLDQAHGVDHDAGRVGGVPHLELDLGRQGHVTEGAALEADVRPLAVGEPRHVIRRADVDVFGAHVVRDLRRDGVRLRDLLRLEALALEHVQEVGVTADVQLVRALELHAAVFVERRERAVHDRRADLALDVVADDRQTGLLEALGPIGLAGDEDRDVVDEGDAGGQRLLDVPLRGLLGTDREVGDEDVGLRVLQQLDDVAGLARRLLDDLGEVLAEAVVRHAALDDDVLLGHARELDRVVLTGEDRVGEVLADLLLVDVNRGDELDVLDVVPAEIDVHQAGDHLIGGSVLVVLNALDEGRGAVADADDGDADLAVRATRAILGSGHVQVPPGWWSRADA